MRSNVAVMLLVVFLAGATGAGVSQAPSEGAETNTEVVSRPPGQGLEPGSEATVPVEVAYNYQRGGAAVSEGPTDVLLSVRNHSPWMEARFSSWVRNVTVEPGTMNSSVTSTLLIAVDGDAPRGAQGEVMVEAFASENDGLASSRGSTTVPIRVAEGANSTGSPSSFEAETVSSDDVASEPVVLGSALLAGVVGLAVGYRV